MSAFIKRKLGWFKKGSILDRDPVIRLSKHMILLESISFSQRLLPMNPAPPVIKMGLNRFEWDLRYPAATSFKGIILWGASATRGPLAPPGIYQVRLTASGKTFTQSFTVKIDPRIKGVTAADIDEQFKLVSMIRDQTSKANEAVIQIRTIKANMTKAGAADKNKTIVDQLSAIEENLYQVRNQSSQDPLNFPIKLNNRLAALSRSIETGESKPTDASYKVYNELTADLKKQLLNLDKLLENGTVKNYLKPDTK